MDIQTVDPSPKTVLQRIDAIIRELQELRKMVIYAPLKPPNDNPVQQLYGALGQGDWKEYDSDLDWQRFAA